jgi:ribosome-binding protein aMBF1 (putative translation factor)
MAEPIKHQIIKQGENPLFVLVPYDEYIDLIRDEELTVPQEVVEKHIIEDKTMIKAWREYKGISQKELSKKIGISQAALSQLESRGTERKSTIEKLAKALELEPEQLSV